MSEGNHQTGFLRLRREKKDLGNKNIYLILNIAYILLPLSFVVVEVLDKIGSECFVMIIVNA